MNGWPILGGKPACGGLEQVLSAIYRALGIEDPENDEAESPACVTIDGFEVAFDQTADETALCVSLAVGSLSADPSRRLDQMRRVLKQNLALLRDFRFCASLEETEDRQWLLLLQFAQAYSNMDMAALTARIGELVFMAETYQELISAPARSLAQPEETAGIAGLDAVIFRP